MIRIARITGRGTWFHFVARCDQCDSGFVAFLEKQGWGLDAFKTICEESVCNCTHPPKKRTGMLFIRYCDQVFRHGFRSLHFALTNGLYPGLQNEFRLNHIAVFGEEDLHEREAALKLALAINPNLEMKVLHG